MRTRTPFIPRGLIVALSLLLTCCTAASAEAPPALQVTPSTDAHQVGSQSFGFAAANAAAYQQMLNQWVWNTTVAQNEAAAAQAAQQAAIAAPKVKEQAATAPVGNSTGSVNGYPCGGDLPPCYVLNRESGGNPTAHNPHSTASGLWQFLDTTWKGYGGYSRAMDAPPSVQNEYARIIWAGGAGCSNWNAC